MKAMSYGGAWECAKLVLNGVNMPGSVTVAHVGSEKIASEIRAAVEHALADHEGHWHVSVIGSHATDRWQLKLEDRICLSGRTRWRELRASTGRR